jgi:molybdopterin molybdotransferase
MSAQEREMIQVEEAWRRIEAKAVPLPPRQAALLEALGCILAQDIFAAEDVPAVPSSTMDGFAVLAADGSTRRRVVAEQRAGLALGLRLEPETAVRIMTGAPLPEGADAVVPVEEVRGEGDFIVVEGPVRQGQYVRARGSDIAAGQLLLRAGTELGPAELGLLAAVGLTHVPVHPWPRVALITTGDEVVPVECAPAPGQVRNSNAVALQAALLQLGLQPTMLRHVPDDLEQTEEALLAAASVADVILTSGGVSMGERDRVRDALNRLGQVHFSRVAVRPGKPLTFASIGATLVFAVPGNPVSSLVSFELFVRPALRRMAGHRRLFRPQVMARLEHPIRHEPDRTEFQRAIVQKREDGYWARTTGPQSSSRLLSLVGANALLRLPAGVAEFPHGAAVSALLVDQPEVP